MESFARRVYLARVRDFVEGAVFPATRAQILKYAERKNTPSEIVRDLNRVPADQFASLDDVVRAIDELRFGAISR
jgi:hypothetical protein